MQMATSVDPQRSHPGSTALLAQQTITSGLRTWEAVAKAAGDLTDTLTRQPSPHRWLATAPWEWTAEMFRRRPPRWASRNEIVKDTPIAALRDFSAAGGRDDVVPTLVLPPQAGHSSSIVDFSERQSQLATIRSCGLTRAYSMDWHAATIATRESTIEDYIEVISAAIAEIGEPVNLIGDCQGGWLAAIYAALRPPDVHTLTLGGAPIDFHAGGAAIAVHTELMTGAFGLGPYRALVAANGGTMPGAAVLAGFIGIKPEAEVGKQLQLLDHLDNEEYVRRYREFEDWFKYTQDISGVFYLWLVEHLFRRNELIAGELVVGGERVDLGRITCPLYLLAGETDHITPPEQLFACAEYVGTPAEQIRRETSAGGHLGLFMGREALRSHWPALLNDVYERSYGDEHSGPTDVQGLPTQRAGRPVMPAP
jgi:poly(3-hydroxyalkanoate) synthetase